MPQRFTPCTQLQGGSVGPKAALGTLDKRKISSLLRIKRFLGRPGLNGHQHNGDVSAPNSSYSHYFFLTFRGPCIVNIFLLIYFQQDATLHSLFISGKLLYMFRMVSPPIIRNTQLYLQYLVLVKPSLLSAAIVVEVELV